MDLENIVIDITQKNHITIPSVQCDSNIRFVTIKIVNNGKQVDVTDYRVTIACKKPDGKIIFNDCEKVGSKIGRVRFEVTEQIGSIAGMIECELRIYGSGNACLTSQPFNIEVTEPILDATTVVSSNEFRALTRAMSDMEEMNDRFEQKYDEVTTQFSDKYQEINNQFNTKYNEIDNQFDTKYNEIVTQFNDKSTSLDTQFANKMTSISNEFDTKSTNLDNQFSQKYNDISTKFQEKYDNLETQYATNLAGKVDNTEVDVNSAANTIVKRNSNGGIHIGNSIEFTTSGQKQTLQVSNEAHVQIGSRTIWDDGNLTIETGSFTPYGYGGDNDQQFTHVTQTGKYYKIGKMVTIVGEIVSDNFNTATGHFRIGGLPFRIRECHTPCSLGYVRGIKTDSSDIQINAFGELGYPFLQFAMNNTNNGSAWSNVTVDKLISRLGVSFSMTYLTD